MRMCFLLHSLYTFHFFLCPLVVASKTTVQVVYAGLARSGTHSLAAALNRLGYSACHGHEISVNIMGSHQALAQALIDNDIETILDRSEELGCNATLELHGMFWREIMARRPNAKYIFIIRDFKKWSAGMRQIFWVMAPFFRYPLRFVPVFDAFAEMYGSLFAYLLQVSRDEVGKFLMNSNTGDQMEKLQVIYDQYVADARTVLARGQKNTLHFNFDQGYPILCEFLDIPADKCPQERFPHIFPSNDARMAGWLLRLQEFLLVALTGLAIWLMCKAISLIWRWIQRRQKPKIS